MRITATPTIPGRVDLSALERLQENNPIEEHPFHASIGPNESIVIDDEYYPLTRIQQSLANGWITITEYAGSGIPDAHAPTHTDGTDDIATMGGDSGAGGTIGLVPAPAAGDTAAGKFLKADGTWEVPPGGGGGGGTWGSIIGTLSDQTDLQTELDAKADITYVDAEAEYVKRYSFMLSLSG